MKSYALAALALTSTVSAAAIKAGQPSTEFDVKDFTAECVPHSVFCYFNLNVTVSPSTSATCGARVESNEDLPDLNSTACSGAPVSFSFKHVDGGANLEINWGYAVGRNLSGTHFVPDSQIVYTNTQVPTGTVQTYEGPADFAITDLQNIAVL